MIDRLKAENHGLTKDLREANVELSLAKEEIEDLNTDVEDFKAAYQKEKEKRLAASGGASPASTKRVTSEPTAKETPVVASKPAAKAKPAAVAKPAPKAKPAPTAKPKVASKLTPAASAGDKPAVMRRKPGITRARPQSMFVKSPVSNDDELASVQLRKKDGRSQDDIAPKRKSSGWKAPQLEKCVCCSKTVYAMEKLVADGKTYCKTGFACSECTKKLGLGNYAAMEGKLFCKPCFKKMFKLKGNYDEGFGKEQHKMKWLKSEEDDGDTEA